MVGVAGRRDLGSIGDHFLDARHSAVCRVSGRSSGDLSADRPHPLSLSPSFRFGGFLGRLALAHRFFGFEADAVRTMDQAVKDGVSKRWIAEHGTRPPNSND